MGFVVTCQALPGLVTHRDTIEEALAHAAEAIELYLECLNLPQNQTIRVCASQCYIQHAKVAGRHDHKCKE